MAYWLLKSEPDVFGWEHLLARPKQSEPWDGVRNYQARNFLRDAMRDATYGAMASAKGRFVVAHHLRTKKAFDDAHAEARSAPEWAPRHAPCVAWNKVADNEGLVATQSTRRELRHFSHTPLRRSVLRRRAVVSIR